MLRLLLKPVPYLLMLFGVLAFFGAVLEMTEERLEEPKQVSLEEVEQTPLSELPSWISISDGYPLWNERVVVNKGPDGAGPLKRVLVPYVSQDQAEGPSDSRKSPITGFLLEFTPETLQQQFPEIAASINGGISESPDPPHQPFTVTFRPEDADVEYALFAGQEKLAVQDMKQAGIDGVAVVRPGSQPGSIQEIVSVTVVAVVIVSLSLFWIQRRRRQPKRSSPRPAISFSASGLARTGMESLRDSFLEACVAALFDKLVSKARREEE